MITLDKKNLRTNALKKRMSAEFKNDVREKSSRVVSKILNSSDFVLAKNVALYFPIKNEIDITGLLNVKGKNFYLPRCNNEELEFVKFSSFDNLKLSKWNILEPLGEKIDPKILDVIYIPALLANTKGYRIGYGKGFYDRFFNMQNLKAKRVIVISSGFILEDDFQDSYDVKCDYIISD